MPTAAADRTVYGIGISFLAFLVCAAADALSKVLSARYSVFQIAAVDGVVALIVTLPFLARQEGWASLRPRRHGVVFLRGAVGALSLLLAFVSFSKIPLANAYSLAFLAPLMVTAMSAPLLGERVGWRQWLAVVIGFVAVLVIVRPDFSGTGAAAGLAGQLAMLASAALFALSMVILRRIAKSESSGALLLVYFAMVFVLGLPVAIADWKSPDLADLGLMVLTGACSGLGNLLLILAFRYTPAAIASSFMYSQLIWGTVFGAILFGDLPDLVTIGGAVVIMLCGIYTLSHASKAARLAVPT